MACYTVLMAAEKTPAKTKKRGEKMVAYYLIVVMVGGIPSIAIPESYEDNAIKLKELWESRGCIVKLMIWDENKYCYI